MNGQRVFPRCLIEVINFVPTGAAKVDIVKEILKFLGSANEYGLVMGRYKNLKFLYIIDIT